MEAIFKLTHWVLFLIIRSCKIPKKKGKISKWISKILVCFKKFDEKFSQNMNNSERIKPRNK